jgi:hypothetical protein
MENHISLARFSCTIFSSMIKTPLLFGLFLKMIFLHDVKLFDARYVWNTKSEDTIKKNPIKTPTSTSNNPTNNLGWPLKL